MSPSILRREWHATAATPWWLAPLACIAFATCATAAAGPPQPLADWTAIPVAAVDARLRQCENLADAVWLLDGQGDQVRATAVGLVDYYESRTDPASAREFSVGRYADFPRTSIAVADGTLVGYNRGEWGGAVWWFSADRTTHRAVSDDQVQAFFARAGITYALEGLDHLGLRRGALVRFGRSATGEWTSTRVVALPGQPGPFAWRGPHSLWLVAGDSLIEVTLDGRVRTLASAPAGFGRASSLVVHHDGAVYLGAGRVVIRLTPHGATFDEDWLMRPDDLAACRSGRTAAR